MKTLRNLIAAASAAVFVLAGCQEEIFNQPVESDNYYASAEAFTADTRTALGQGRSVVWSAGDQVAIFEGTSAGKAYQVTEASVGSGTGEFTLVKNLCTDATAEIPENTIAIYPFSKSLTVEPASNSYFYVNAYNINGITFPSRQTYTPGSFSDEAFPMIAVTQKGGRELAFKNIGGVIKLSLTGSCAVSEITIEGHNNEYLSGPIEISLTPPDNKFNTGANIYIVPNRTSKSVTLVCDPAVQLDSEKATDFFISIPPTEFKSGFTATITDSEGNKSTKSTNKANEVRRSTILAMPEVDNDRDKEIQKYESPYGYDVTKFVKGIEKDIEFPEDVQIIMDWLKEQEFVESVECDEYYKVIHIKFKDSTDFYIVNEQDERILQLSPPSCGEVIIGGLTYNIESQSDEVIQDNNKILYVRADAENPIFYEDGISSKYTPVDIEVVTTDGFDYFEDDLSAYGSILISHTHGVPQGHFCISDSSIPDGKAIRGIIRDVDEKTFHPTCITDYKDLYSRIGNNNPFVFANYCWSAKGVEDYVSIGSFVGYDILSYIKENADNSDSYFSGLFKGMTHLEAFNRLSAMDFPAWTVPETGEARDWTPYVRTTPQQYGEPNMRYYSITTEEPDTKDGKAIIKGKINGYKNLRNDVQYKVFLYDGTLSEMPLYPNIPETAIDLTVADDGTIHQDISEYLEQDIEYSFNIGIEYYGNYYIGDSKKIKMKEVTYNVDNIIKNIDIIDEVVNPLFKECEDIKQLSSHLEKIENLEAVKEAWTTSNALYVRTPEGFQLSWVYTPEINNEITSKQYKTSYTPRYTSASYDTKSTSYDKHNTTHTYNNVCIINQTSNCDFRTTTQGIKGLCDSLETTFNNNGFNAETIDGPKANLDFFENKITEYDIIFLITHGSYDEKGNHWLCTGQLYDKEELKAKLKELINEHKNTSMVKNMIEKFTIKELHADKVELVDYFSISEEYINHEIKGSLPNSIIFNIACESLKGSTDGKKLSMAFQGKGAALYLGYDDVNNIGHRAGKEFFDNMIKGTTVEEAFNKLRSEYREQIFYDSYLNLYTPTLKYLPEANKDICIAHLTPVTKDTTMVKGTTRLNGTFETPVKGQFENYELGFCYSYTTSTPTVEDSEVIYVENSEIRITENTDYYAELKDIKHDETCCYRFFFKNPHSGEYVYGDTKSFELEFELEMDKWVDLGLSVLWASRNLGAQSPNNYGEYYAWGEVTTSPRYNWYSYDFSFYVSDEKPAYWACTYLGDDISGTSYDAASKNWGGGARMPTHDEINELIEKCTAETGFLNGTYGKYFTGPNGNTIFLPFAGGYGDKQENYGKSGSYWSSTLSPGGANSWAYTLSMSSNYDPRDNISLRYYGHSIRPVKSK